MLSTRLKALRIEKKLTQKQLAEKINVTHVSISGYESGNRSPDTDTLQRLADYFEVSTDYLLGRTNIPALTPQEKDEAAFQAFANDPELNVFYKELPESDEEAVRKLRNIWEIIKNEKK
ncbi:MULTISPECIES: helix-turn-helix domain-containing protein [Lysinibacillus]|uniref:Helix-turn-helix transcriptional regulator n=1 Tax=Lysinibacillus tabacifolii TaxID=1173107 RepID=A0ABY2T8M8_9BACI|nr:MULTISPECIES: helix-turn-helix transcriptional regulator [Lysinibacillus]TKI50619.1 helix-turn-helix transcriptional regulator [Lysinibacillus tabacifolii]